jgi:Zn-dependent M16 (insulinase) family peptidase
MGNIRLGSQPLQRWFSHVSHQVENFSSKMEQSLVEYIAPLIMELGRKIEDNDIETRARLTTLEEQQEHTSEQIFKILDTLKMGDDINDNIREQLEDLPEGTDQIVDPDISYGGTTDA